MARIQKIAGNSADEQVSLARDEFRDSGRLKQALADSDEMLVVICEIASQIAAAIASGGKVLLMGNGGSAADAQHMAAEFVGRFVDRERKAFPAVALTTDSSILTAVANDFGFDAIFERQIEALAQEGDVAIAISTSGSSENVLKGVHAARRKRLTTVALTGKSGSLAEEADYAVRVPSDETSRIQEAHITIGHVICKLVESSLSRASGGRAQL